MAALYASVASRYSPTANCLLACAFSASARCAEAGEPAYDNAWRVTHLCRVAGRHLGGRRTRHGRASQACEQRGVRLSLAAAAAAAGVARRALRRRAVSAGVLAGTPATAAGRGLRGRRLGTRRTISRSSRRVLLSQSLRVSAQQTKRRRTHTQTHLVSCGAAAVATPVVRVARVTAARNSRGRSLSHRVGRGVTSAADVAAGVRVCVRQHSSVGSHGSIVLTMRNRFASGAICACGVRACRSTRAST